MQVEYFRPVTESAAEVENKTGARFSQINLESRKAKGIFLSLSVRTLFFYQTLIVIVMGKIRRHLMLHGFFLCPWGLETIVPIDILSHLPVDQIILGDKNGG